MGVLFNKIINDPVYGFITIDHPLIADVIADPYYQRLRRIQQMAFASLVYPGAVHTRLHHSLGAYHLMCSALQVLKGKGIEITEEEALGAKIAILLHDVGHGPFSHALEQELLTSVSHEEISMRIMQELNKKFGGKLDIAISIFNNSYQKLFLHQLISGQLDVDRMDYLTRDSFFTGVAEGVIGYDRILKMLTVKDGGLMVEEKGIYSIEKFLLSRRLMYWQVYLHKTVLCAEKMLIKIIQRAKELIDQGSDLASGSDPLDFFLRHKGKELHLDRFCLLDDYDVMGAIKKWVFHSDPVLSRLCSMLIDRKLLKATLQNIPVDPGLVEEKRAKLAKTLKISKEEAAYFVFTGETTNTTYDPTEEYIEILFKDGVVKDISRVDNAIIQQALSSPVKKFYICYIV
jgi:uncharacterized protein